MLLFIRNMLRVLRTGLVLWRAAAARPRGRRSSARLADCFKRFEGLGLDRRDSARDAVIGTDSRGLRSLKDVSSRCAPEGAVP